MLLFHTVPSIVANTKQRAEVFQDKWNYYIGKSILSYGRNDDGKKLLNEIKSRRLGPRNSIHRKEVYL
ncbi:MAG: hypothetical protein ACKVG2_03635 [Candidatus Poseidoniales archaeon]|jgi:hypothetical protein